MYNYGYGYTTTAAATAGLAVGIIILIIFLALIAIAAYVVSRVGLMKVFKKAGKPSWAAWVPIYSDVLLCEIAGIDPRWILIVLYSGVVCIIPILGWLLYLAILVYFSILLYVSLARAFGKSDGFAVGLILIDFVFIPILGFGDAKYGKVNPMNDIIFKKKSN